MVKLSVIVENHQIKSIIATPLKYDKTLKSIGYTFEVYNSAGDARTRK